jgi:hypothetical protein
MSMVGDEEAKAVQEVAKTTGKLAEVAQRAGAFIASIIGDAATELGLGLGDWAALVRYKNLCRIQDKVEAIHRQRALEGKALVQVPPRLAIPLLQHASQEDDESLQNLWAGLIVNATDPEKIFNVDRLHVNLLSSLEPLDARVLAFLHQRGLGVDMIILDASMSVPAEALRLSLINLGRLGLIVDYVPDTFGGTTGDGSWGRVHRADTSYSLSSLGQSLLRACGVDASN